MQAFPYNVHFCLIVVVRNMAIPILIVVVRNVAIPIFLVKSAQKMNKLQNTNGPPRFTKFSYTVL